jgi:hypothetical protein
MTLSTYTSPLATTSIFVAIAASIESKSQAANVQVELINSVSDLDVAAKDISYYLKFESDDSRRPKGLKTDEIFELWQAEALVKACENSGAEFSLYHEVFESVTDTILFKAEFTSSNPVK